MTQQLRPTKPLFCLLFLDALFGCHSRRTFKTICHPDAAACGQMMISITLMPSHECVCRGCKTKSSSSPASMSRIHSTRRLFETLSCSGFMSYGCSSNTAGGLQTHETYERCYGTILFHTNCVDLGKSSLAHSLEHVAKSRRYRVDSPGRVNKIVADHYIDAIPTEGVYIVRQHHPRLHRPEM